MSSDLPGRAGCEAARRGSTIRTVFICCLFEVVCLRELFLVTGGGRVEARRWSFEFDALSTLGSVSSRMSDSGRGPSMAGKPFGRPLHMAKRDPICLE